MTSRSSQAVAGRPLLLAGDPFVRGAAQAGLCPDMIEPVRHAIEHRLAETARALAHPAVRRFIAGQYDYTRRAYPAILDEIHGLAEGFGIPEATLFDYLHCSSAMDMAALRERDPDGCTSFAVTLGVGAILAKNRDYRTEHVAIQRVMLHRDPAWGGRAMLVLGSLGSPGNFSSGMNSDGLAVSDTASRTTDMGIGLHRYFLLTRLLTDCADVGQALGLIRRTTHTGSGLLILADAKGAVAAVELGHRQVGIEQHRAGRVGRTNHFVTREMTAANLLAADSAASRANSERRWSVLPALLGELGDDPGVDAVAGLLAYHGGQGGAAFCRHGGGDLSATIAGAIYLTRERRMLVALGNPCASAWRRYEFKPAASAAAAQ
ncbi:MAG: hypothetical protein IT562_13545 [Alphaproteobacteria bacterium]|nr:hypothetical protein [Alphaproteobacteria bacterium]